MGQPSHEQLVVEIENLRPGLIEARLGLGQRDLEAPNLLH